MSFIHGTITNVIFIQVVERMLMFALVALGDASVVVGKGVAGNVMEARCVASSYVVLLYVHPLLP